MPKKPNRSEDQRPVKIVYAKGVEFQDARIIGEVGGLPSLVLSVKSIDRDRADRVTLILNL